MLKVRALECRRGASLLMSDFNMSLEAGQLIHLQGANGTGKTSLLRIISGLSTQETGKVLWNDVDIRTAREDYSSNLIYIGHQPAIKDDLTVLENLTVSLKLNGVNVDIKRLEEALEVVGLARRKNLPARVLSQGQRRRLSLARLWLDPRPLWILDEPFNALDVQANKLLEERLDQHLVSSGMCILTSHHTPNIDKKLLTEVSLGL